MRWLVMVLAACGAPSVIETAAPEETETETETESLPTESESETETEPPPPDDLCTEEGRARRAWISTGDFGSDRRDLADDFTVLTADGAWTFSEQFTGCESYIFVSDLQPTSPIDDTPMVHQVDQLESLIAKSPTNVHYFFVSYDEDFADRMQADLDEALALSDDEDAEHFAERLHVVTETLSDAPDWVADAIYMPGFAFAIDRFQRVREVGSLADVRQYEATLNSMGYWPWNDSVAYTAHMAQAFNYESDLDLRGEDPAFTTLYMMYDEPVWLTGNDRKTVTFPDAATMAEFDTMLFDLRHVCDPELDEWGNCDAWDAVQSIWLCDADDVCTVELARYITTYHREGRWIADASQLLPYVQAGGAQRLWLAGVRGGHYVTVRVLLGKTRDDGLTPYQVVPLWTGGSFDSTYNDNHPPMTVDVPADMVQATLQVTVTGHGMSSGDNCAEFCDHTHTFSTGAGSWTAEHPEIWDDEGCLDQIDRGTVPNQYGTWWYNRSSWCPGKQVDPWLFDVTAELTPGSQASLGYTTNEGEVTGGTIELRTFLVFWK